MLASKLTQSSMCHPAAEVRPAPDGNSLAVEVLDTWRCLELAPKLGEFEDSVFGPDFAMPNDAMDRWAKSGSLFYAAITGQAVVGRLQIFSLLSVLVTTSQCRDELLAGELLESELDPWTAETSGSAPALYLASVISASSEHLALMYDSVGRELQEFKTAHGAHFQGGCGIASGPAGYSHLFRNGFRSIEGQSYLGHYPLMSIDAESAATPFWQQLLRKDNIPAVEDAPARPPLAVLPTVAYAS